MSEFDPLLMIPGPTNLPPEVRDALSGPGFYHRGEQMSELLARCTRGLQGLMGTTGDVLTLASSGTGALEAAITGFLSPGDRVLAIEAGKFGERLREIAAAFGADVTSLTVAPGHAVHPDEVSKALDGADYRALLTVYNETSTGVMHPIREIAAAARQAGALVICDCVSCLGGIEVQADEWGIDVVCAGSQKCLMLPPGLAFVGVRDEAWPATERAEMPSYYFDLQKARAKLRDGQTPYTPATTLIAGLGAALDLIEAEGREAVFARHARMADATRAAMEAAGLQLFAEATARSRTVTAVHSPVDSVKLVGYLRDTHNVLISGGQGDLKGRIFRVGHMGAVRIEQIEQTVEALADGLSNLGHECDGAAMVNAAREAAEASESGAR